ncbi:MAG: chemotaxis protein CheY [Sulfurovum sp. FS06-10]|nr:MAG: chemotaxis protein CheY [Sulfurovum sp. FS06-10]
MFENSKIMIVDDIIDNIRVAIGHLQELKCQITYATNGKDALERALANKPDLILMDVMMPFMDGFETARTMKVDTSLEKIPIIFLTAKTDIEDIKRGFECGGVDYIAKPFDGGELISRVKTHLELSLYRQALEEQVSLRTQDIESLKCAVIEAMGSLAEYRDNETGEHIRRTQLYTNIMCEYMMAHGMHQETITPEYTKLFFQSAPLHDIGKVGIKDTILLKPDKLTDEEFSIMKRHAVFGEKVIAKLLKRTGPTEFLEVAKEIAGGHHEKWDGSGYPRGLKGNAIPLCARIMAVADVYDALVSQRVYKAAFSHEETLHIMNQGAGTHFDPQLIEILNALAEDFNHIAQTYKD